MKIVNILLKVKYAIFRFLHALRKFAPFTFYAKKASKWWKIQLRVMPIRQNFEVMSIQSPQEGARKVFGDFWGMTTKRLGNTGLDFGLIKKLQLFSP